VLASADLTDPATTVALIELGAVVGITGEVRDGKLINGIGQFFDPRVGVEVLRTPDQVTPKLPALYDSQISLNAPAPAEGSFDASAATRGKAFFQGSARCSTCHSGTTLSDAGERLHAADETGMEPLHAQRSAPSATARPLCARCGNSPYFHDGSAATLAAVVQHYDARLGLGLGESEQADLIEYLKSL
jgi:mono/diheme cytochrome c family protein